MPPGGASFTCKEGETGRRRALNNRGARTAGPQRATMRGTVAARILTLLHLLHLAVMGAGEKAAVVAGNHALATAIARGQARQKAAWTTQGRSMARGPQTHNSCYTVCPKTVFSTGHDPYYDTAHYQYEKEIHPSPFPGRPAVRAHARW